MAPCLLRQKKKLIFTFFKEKSRTSISTAGFFRRHRLRSRHNEKYCREKEAGGKSCVGKAF